MPIPLPVIANTFRCALNWRDAGSQTAVNVIHIKATAGGVTATQVFEAMQDAFTVNMWDSVASSATINKVQITSLNGTAATEDFDPAGAANFSGAPGGAFIPSTAVIVKFTTGFRGRAFRGRAFLPFTTENVVTDGFFDPATAAIQAAAWQAMNAALIADTPSLSLAVASYDRRHAGAGAQANAVTGITVESPVATQRRRQGRNR